MAERSDELTRDDEVTVDNDAIAGDTGEFDGGAGDIGVDPEEFDTEFGVGKSATTETESTTDTDSSRVGRVRRRAGSIFSPTTFVLQLAAMLVGAFAAGTLIPVVPFTGFLGILVMAGLMGTISSRPRYVEAAVAGGASGAVALFFGAIGLTMVTGGTVPLVGAVVGALAALVGFYAGRDIRDGVTRDL